jgi:hypothetical protein
MPSIASIRFDVNPQVAIALEQLGVLLTDYHYSQHAKERILAYTAVHGTPSGCPELDREDEHDAELVFTSELPAVPFDSSAWDREIDTVTLDVEMLLAGTHPFPLMDPCEGPDEVVWRDDAVEPDSEPRAPDEDWYHPHSPNHPANRPGALPRLSGGSPDYEPTPEDLQDLAAWSEALDRERDIEDARDWYRRNPLSQFNDHIRNDD